MSQTIVEKIAQAGETGPATVMITGLADDVWGWDPRLKLAGQLHIAVGDMATYYLHNAVYLLEEFLDTADNPRTT